MKLACAICYRLSAPDEIPEDAITIANGHATCARHFQRLHRWQSTNRGPMALEALVEIMFAPDKPPTFDSLR